MQPIVAIAACRRSDDGVLYDTVRTRYVSAVVELAGAVPLILPAIGGALDRNALLASIDGLLLTGSESNIEPHRYGMLERATGESDPGRDETLLPLIPAAVAAGVPVFGICRGLQEMNVAYGGDLHAELHTTPGIIDHREDETLPRDRQYLPAHAVALHSDGQLRRWIGAAAIEVNSLHGQGIRRLANGLVVEATASDGLVEAASVRGARAFAIGVQWHPEWHASTDAISRLLFERFGQACRECARSRYGGAPGDDATLRSQSSAKTKGRARTFP